MKARRFVLAMGGVETTRFLLHTQRRWPGQFGGAGGALGRYYMGHISGKIASIVFDDPAAMAIWISSWMRAGRTIAGGSC